MMNAMDETFVERMHQVLELVRGDCMVVIGEDGVVSLFAPTRRETDGHFLAKGVFEMLNDQDWRRRVIARAREKFSTEPS